VNTVGLQKSEPITMIDVKHINIHNVCDCISQSV